MHKAEYIECPYCKHIHSDHHDYLEVGDLGGEFQMNCVGCKEQFKVDFYSVFWFETKKK
ncbi:hypothetical protein [Bacillus thuringiensis]|uniref:hypothetical protein n=1 Tax=Bacillus thuringiensis TaxID=1428 RepID=UPI0026E4465A|nr:hypothetical protein [Bacillus thuringiensis]MDO6631827.1 hypothetical protein [Bacillus thuringiensis]MDO6661514.1 hypothetical protein [Bacillus thuringiensis]MDO6701967.1 hypothetical protein [Bacillus thuringiensis]